MRKAILTILILALPLVCFAQDAVTQATPEYEEKNIDMFIQRAIDYGAEGNFERSYGEYKNASMIKRTQLMGKYLKLLEGILNGKVEEDIGLHLFKGLQLWSYVKLDESIAEFEYVAKVKPDCELAHYLVGYSCFHSYCATLKGLEYPISSFKKAIEIDPNFATAYYWLAFSYAFSEQADIGMKNKCELVVKYYDKAIELDDSLKDLPVDPAEPSAEDIIGVCKQILRGEIPIDTD